MMVFDVAIIGAGIAGLTAALEARRRGATVIVLDKEGYVGGRLTQAINKDFGTALLGEAVTGPELIDILLTHCLSEGVEIRLHSFVRKVIKNQTFEISFVSPKGWGFLQSASLILASGAREKTADELFLYGDRPSGIFTAGEVQYYVNVLGKMPTKKCVMIGSSDLGLHVARSLTLEGAHVEGVYESRSYKNCCDKNQALCLSDFNIPLYTSHKVVKLYGNGRLKSVSVAQIEHGKIVDSSVRSVDCDAVVLAADLICVNGIARELGAAYDKNTGYITVDQNMATTIDGLYVAGNCQMIYNNVDQITESALIAARAAVSETASAKVAYAKLTKGKGVAYVIPNLFDITNDNGDFTCFFKPLAEYDKVVFTLLKGGEIVHTQYFPHLDPYEIQRVVLNLSNCKDEDEFKVELQQVTH